MAVSPNISERKLCAAAGGQLRLRCKRVLPTIHSTGTPPALATDISYVASTPQNVEHTAALDDSDFENTQGADNPLGSQIGFPGDAAAAAGG